jgi:chromate reductase
MEKYKIIGICGSLREQSYNKSILEYIAANSPDSMEIQIESISDFPLFNEDIEKEGFPLKVQDIREKIRNADGLIIITPEYNSSVPGVLKNAVDWISRKDENGYPFSKKPIMIAGATTGLTGTSRSQKELRAVLHNINTFPMNKPELFISQADKKIFNGKLVDEKTKEVIGKMLNSFSRWIELIKKY